IFVITIQELFFGPGGSAVKGDKFAGAAYPLGVALRTAQGAVPGDSWQGEAADAYAARNQTHIDRITKILTLDATTKTLIDSEAAKSKFYRQQITVTKDGLAACIPVAMLLNFKWPPASIAFQLVVSLAALGGVSAMCGLMGEYSRNVTAAGEAPVIAEYRDLLSKVIADLQALGAPIPDRVLQSAPPSAAPTFREIVNAGAPPSAPAVPGGQDARRTPPRARTDGGESTARYGGDELYDEPTEPSETENPETPPSPAAPIVAMPTLAQMSQLSAQAAKMSGSAAQHMNLVNQTMGSVQQLASTAQQGAGAAAPAEAAAEAEAGPAGLDAASGAEGAERAPVDAAANAEQAADANPAERIV
ncbi:EspA/EspE family type VII secretion system effector, partial [Mycobacterium sp. Lab-001]|uniref:EspA/EspE family type VII secretion system effector n=1 Tax=Mycobacterium sp. Lab-001 TaxID=3410136 RepID=UPI003D179AC8